MNNYPYIIIDDSDDLIAIRETLDEFPAFQFLSSASTQDALDVTVGSRPKVIFYKVSDKSQFDSFIGELYRYFKEPPKIFGFADDPGIVLSDCYYTLSTPTRPIDLIKAILRFERNFNDTLWATLIVKPLIKPALNGSTVHLPVSADSIASDTDAEIESAIIDEGSVGVEHRIEVKDPIDASVEKPLTICVKSYGDYRFIDANEIAYLKADNNSTDIHLNNGEMITAFKTLKHFESVLNNPFIRIHNSYIVNIDYVSRIHTGNSVCYLKHSGIKLPFSKSYKENIDAILRSITKGNYLEI